MNFSRPCRLTWTLFALGLGTCASACHADGPPSPGADLVSCPGFSYLAGDACVAFPPLSDARLSIEPDATVAADTGVDDAAPTGDAEATSTADTAAGTFTVVCDAGVPVPECVEYYGLLGACTGADDRAWACQTGAATDASDRAALAQLCIINIQRVQQACR